jgi:hypothetical protein
MTIIKNIISLWNEIYNNTFGIEHYTFLFFTIIVILFWVFYMKALYNITRHYLNK